MSLESATILLLVITRRWLHCHNIATEVSLYVRMCSVIISSIGEMRLTDNCQSMRTCDTAVLGATCILFKYTKTSQQRDMHALSLLSKKMRITHVTDRGTQRQRNAYSTRYWCLSLSSMGEHSSASWHGASTRSIFFKIDLETRSICDEYCL